MSEKPMGNKSADANLSPQQPVNYGTTEAEHLLRFDTEQEAHVDEKGNPILDKMGRPYD